MSAGVVQKVFSVHIVSPSQKRTEGTRWRISNLWTHTRNRNVSETIKNGILEPTPQQKCYLMAYKSKHRRCPFAKCYFASVAQVFHYFPIKKTGGCVMCYRTFQHLLWSGKKKPNQKRNHNPFTHFWTVLKGRLSFSFLPSHSGGTVVSPSASPSGV